MISDRVLAECCTQEQLLEFNYAAHLKEQAYALLRDPSPDVRRTALETYSYALTLLDAWWRDARKTYPLPSGELLIDLSSGHFIARVCL